MPIVTLTGGYLSQQPVTIVSASPELRAVQNTTITTYTLLLPPSVPVTSASEVDDLDDGGTYRAVGSPATRAGLSRSPKFQAVSLHRISDLQPLT